MSAPPFSKVAELPPRYREFTAQSEQFLAVARTEYPDAAAASLDSIFAREPRPLDPVLLRSADAVSAAERDRLAAQYFGEPGVAHFALSEFDAVPGEHHAILRLAEQLTPSIPLGYPVDHPMEQHEEARSRFGEPDGTLKLYNLPIPPGVDKYREQAETKEQFAAHNDGLGYGGAVISSTIALESPPAWGGYTCFQHLVRVALALANDDPEAFEALFVPDAIVALRPRGKGAIKVTAPVLYVDERGEPRTFFRVASGEYRIVWRDDIAALLRARDLLIRLAQPFAPSSTFVHLMRPGQGVIIRNTQIVHSRTPFEDGAYGARRVLARKWFVETAADARYKHVPGMNVASQYADLFPEFFARELCEGEWHYDAETGENVRIA